MTIQVAIDIASKVEVQKWGNWLNQYKDQVKISDNEGCGCCVDIFKVSGDSEILKTLPLEIV